MRVDLQHGRVTLALHRLREDGAGRPLLLLHGLGDRSPAAVPAWAAAWPSGVWALDFTGHGDSTLPRGGGYTAEILLADVDAALASLGPATLLGRGLGAYVALLVAGARPGLVRGAILTDGPGLAGGGTEPASTMVLDPAPDVTVTAPDPFALVELARDIRPADYATGFARQATQLSGLEWALAVCARWRPPWLEAVAAEPGVLAAPLSDALDHYGTMA
jgi:pimeloyl-ACP methyl ester carboxylesterase